MKARMRVKLSGSRDGVEWPDAGTVVDLPEDEITALIQAGHAVPLERATTEEPETATAPRKATKRTTKK